MLNTQHLRPSLVLSTSLNVLLDVATGARMVWAPLCRTWAAVSWGRSHVLKWVQLRWPLGQTQKNRREKLSAHVYYEHWGRGEGRTSVLKSSPVQSFCSNFRQLATGLVATSCNQSFKRPVQDCWKTTCNWFLAYIKWLSVMKNVLDGPYVV